MPARAAALLRSGELAPRCEVGAGEAGLTLRILRADEDIRLRASRRPLPPPKSITVVVAHFDDLLSGGLRALLDAEAHIEIVAAGVEQSRLSTVIGAHRPDVAILDAGALVKLAAVQELSVRHPHTSLVVLANEPSDAESAQLLAFGAAACLGTDAQARDVLNAIHLASRGLRLTARRAQGAGNSDRAAGQLLTRREAEVLPMLREGQSSAQIALALGIGIETVRTHTRNIYRKLGVSSRRELIAPSREPSSTPDVAEPLRPRRRIAPGTQTRLRGHRQRPH